jgi:hypothetical protein
MKFVILILISSIFIFNEKKDKNNITEKLNSQSQLEAYIKSRTQYIEF